MSDPDVEAGLKEVELNEVEMEAEKLPMTGGAGDSNGALKAKEAGCGGAGGGGGGAGEAGGPGSGGPGAGEGGSFGGLSKEELLRVAGSPGWVRLRWALLLLFWLGWIAMLAGAALIIVRAPRCRALPQLGWWARGPVYRLRVGAFQDSQGDGRGDLAGVAMRMDELAALKMKAVVIGPIHRTAPDMINETKLTEIDSIYGDMEQFDSLLQVARRKGIKVILDLTPNYLGKQEWFGINFNGTDGDLDLLREKEAFHFWLQKGVDGLQLGGIEQVLSSTPNRFLEWQNLTRNYSADAKERILIGATGVTELQEIIRQQNISDADLLSSGYLHRVLKAPAPLSPQSVWDSVNAYINGIGKSWPCWAMGGSTHMASLDANLAGLVPVMLYTLPGTPFIYYGDEIGLQPTTPDQDPWMMWNSSENAGFTTKRSDMGKPSLNETVEGQKVDGSSRLSLFKKLGLLKVKERSLQYGEAYSVLMAGGVVAYVRSWDQSDRFLVLLNFGEEPTTASMAEVADMPAKATVELSSLGTRPNAEISLHDIKLASGEGLVLKFPFVA